MVTESLTSKPRHLRPANQPSRDRCERASAREVLTTRETATASVSAGQDRAPGGGPLNRLNGRAGGIACACPYGIRTVRRA